MSEAAVPRRTGGGAPTGRQMLVGWTVLCLLAALAWAVTVRQAAGMGAGPGTMGLSLWLFLVLWILMMAAMMFPSVAPVAILWTRTVTARSTGTRRAGRMTLFLSGYLIAWAGYGLLAYAALIGGERLVEASPTGATWLGAGLVAAAGIYQLTPLKNVCLRHCRSPIGAMFHYAGFREPLRDLKVGLHHGAYCVGCCWGLMIVLVVVGVMNIAVMAALSVVIAIEKLWRRGPGFARVVGIVLISFAVLSLFFPALLPGLHRAPVAPTLSGPGSTQMGNS